VIVQGLIGADGRVRETRLQNSSGYARLDNAALQAVRHWRCQPVMRDGVLQEAWRNAPVDFILK
jgi:protein TonB